MEALLVSLLAQFGLPGLVILGMFAFIWDQQKSREGERKALIEAIGALQERFDKQNEMIFEVLRDTIAAITETREYIERRLPLARPEGRV